MYAERPFASAAAIWMLYRSRSKETLQCCGICNINSFGFAPILYSLLSVDDVLSSRPAADRLDLQTQVLFDVFNVRSGLGGQLIVRRAFRRGLAPARQFLVDWLDVVQVLGVLGE